MLRALLEKGDILQTQTLAPGLSCDYAQPRQYWYVFSAPQRHHCHQAEVQTTSVLKGVWGRLHV